MFQNVYDGKIYFPADCISIWELHNIWLPTWLKFLCVCLLSLALDTDFESIYTMIPRKSWIISYFTISQKRVKPQIIDHYYPGSAKPLHISPRCCHYLYGLDPGIALVSIGLYGEIRETRVYIFPGASSPVCPGFRNEPLRQRTR